MESVLRQKVTVGPGGRVEIPTSELVPGTTAEILVLFPEGGEMPPATLEKESSGVDAEWSKHWAASDRLISEGMETWDLDRVNAEIAAGRGGDREVL